MLCELCVSYFYVAIYWFFFISLNWSIKGNRLMKISIILTKNIRRCWWSDDFSVSDFYIQFLRAVFKRLMHVQMHKHTCTVFLPRTCVLLVLGDIWQSFLPCWGQRYPCHLLVRCIFKEIDRKMNRWMNEEEDWRQVVFNLVIFGEKK